LVGDLITIKPGDNITVDGILLEGTESVEVDESMITGLTDTLSK
jgi:Ca2+ transporting ATPase